MDDEPVQHHHDGGNRSSRGIGGDIEQWKKHKAFDRSPWTRRRWTGRCQRQHAIGWTALRNSQVPTVLAKEGRFQRNTGFEFSARCLTIFFRTAQQNTCPKLLHRLNQGSGNTWPHWWFRRGRHWIKDRQKRPPPCWDFHPIHVVCGRTCLVRDGCRGSPSGLAFGATEHHAVSFLGLGGRGMSRGHSRSAGQLSLNHVKARL